MSNFKLNLPTDIPWERICVTEDMIDRRVCDDRLPAKWQTSMAVFRYRPDEEDQLYPNYNITYLKVTATLTGYQPLDQEVQGQIDWNGVDVTTVPGLKDLLNSYNPCHGAILQVVVGPKDRDRVALDQYPFFLDFEPKKRELYELATDTKEKQSRSIESLNITKSAGNTQSMEILDVDMGGGGFGAQAQYAGTGGGFSYQAPNGQWGTRRVNADESLASRSSDVGQEKRETFSYSTQLSQMYHLLDSYHLGTNRVVFFVQPRPHTLEEPSGFVRGPRPVEGIQEFFMVVAQPKEQEDFCVSLRLDTSHLTKTPIMDYERKSETTSIAAATAPVASKNDIPAENIVGARACFIDCWDVHYQCYRTESTDSVTYNAPAGFRIESYNDLVNQSSHGSTSVVVSPNGASLNINVAANGHKCFEGSEMCVNCPDEIQAWAGSARRQVQVNLISTTPTRKVGEEEVLMITTRGLCCCSDEVEYKPMDEYVVDILPIPEVLRPKRPSLEREVTHLLTPAAESDLPEHAGVRTHGPRAATHGLERQAAPGHGDEPCHECADKIAAATAGSGSDAGYTIRQANELGGYLRTETLKSLNDPTAVPKKYIETDYFAKALEYQVVQTGPGREKLSAPAAESLPKQAVAAAARKLGRKPGELSVRDVWAFRTEELAAEGKVDPDELRRLRLTTLGVQFTDDANGGKPGGGRPGGDKPGGDKPGGGRRTAAKRRGGGRPSASS